MPGGKPKSASNRGLLGQLMPKPSPLEGKKPIESYGYPVAGPDRVIQSPPSTADQPGRIWGTGTLDNPPAPKRKKGMEI